MNEITILGKTDWRNTNQIFGIKQADRLRHMYVIGGTGTGKTTQIQTMAISDLMHGRGFCFVDPHGDASELLLHYVPYERIKDVIYFNPSDQEYCPGFNPLLNIPPVLHSIVTSCLINTFQKHWSLSWGPRMEHVLRFSILTLLQYPNSSLLDVQTLLTNPYFRKAVLNDISDKVILNFWRNEYERYTPAMQSEIISPILNKMGLFSASVNLRNIVGRTSNTLNIPDIMNGSKILICNLSKGLIGEEACALLGSMLLTAIHSVALSRATTPIEQRVPFYLYVDECHSFMTLTFTGILSEARKYKLGLLLTNQYIEQLDERIRTAIFGNVGTLISFRVSYNDAEYLANQFYPVFDDTDLINLPNYSMYVRLMIDGTTSKPFSAVSMEMPSYKTSYKGQIMRSRIKQELPALAEREIAISDRPNNNTLFDL